MKKTITICSSASFYKQVLETEKELKKMGFKVKIPKTARVMQRANNFNDKDYRIWFKDKKEYKKKTELLQSHIKKVIESDAILVINLEKNDIPGYIGGNVLIEMAIAFHYKKPIFVYNQISDLLNIAEEVYGLNSIFIDQDLKKIKI